MSKQELKIDYDYYESDRFSYEDLREAADRLTSTTQDQFEEIKNEKWFNRVFDLLTFSKKNEKRIASQIGSLAQAQQLVMEILVRLSARDNQISELVSECFDKLQTLSQNDVLLAKRIKQLENSCILGINKQTDIADLSQLERQILGGIFYALMQEFEGVSGEQQRYANSVLNYIGVEAQQVNTSKAIDALDSIEVKKKILTCCMEYGFLNNFTFDYTDNFQNIMDEFDFGTKTIKEIKKKIQATYNLRGAEGFIDKYGSEDYSSAEEEFFIEIEEENEQETEPEMTEVKITNILRIEPGETKEFKYNEVHINSYVNCEGDLLFENCIVYYNEPGTTDEITLAEGAAVKFVNSKIICKGVEKTFFIQGKGANEIILANCELESCSYFIDMRNESKIMLDGCKINNPSVKFLNGNASVGMITNSSVNFSDVLEQNKEIMKDEWPAAIFSCDSYNASDEFLIKECTVTGDKEFLKEIQEIQLFDISKAIYENCSFTNVYKCISKAQKVSKCKFTNCSEVINNDMFSITPVDKIIDNCVFLECEKIIEAGKGSSVTNCQFVKCRNRILGTSFYGGVSIEFCEFYNLEYEKDDNFNGEACFYFQRTKLSDSSGSTLKKCIFNGFNAGEGFLIMGNVFEKISGPTAYIEDCSFQNCTTKRSSGKIIKEYGYYFGLFNKQVDVRAVSVDNCKGLDKINKESGHTENVQVKSMTLAGQRIGAAR